MKAWSREVLRDLSKVTQPVNVESKPRSVFLRAQPPPCSSLLLMVSKLNIVFVCFDLLLLREVFAMCTFLLLKYRLPLVKCWLCNSWAIDGVLSSEWDNWGGSLQCHICWWLEEKQPLLLDALSVLLQGPEAHELELHVGCFPLSREYGNAWLNWDPKRTEGAVIPVGKHEVGSSLEGGQVPKLPSCSLRLCTK